MFCEHPLAAYPSYEKLVSISEPAKTGVFVSSSERGQALCTPSFPDRAAEI